MLVELWNFQPSSEIASKIMIIAFGRICKPKFFFEKIITSENMFSVSPTPKGPLHKRKNG